MTDGRGQRGRGGSRDGWGRRGAERWDDEPPFPSPFQALLLTVLTACVTQVSTPLLFDVAAPTLAARLALAIAAGAAAVLAAPHLPEPQAERVGLRGLRPAHLPPLLLLAPLAALAGALEPLLAAWLDAAPPALRVRALLAASPPPDWIVALVTLVGMAPLLEEWLFRGLLQQGLIASLGARAGLLASALLFALAHAAAEPSLRSALAAGLPALGLGLVLGWVRVATGSLFAAIALHAAVNGLVMLSAALAGVLPDLRPLAPGLLAASLVSVVLGGLWIARVPQAALRAEEPVADEDGWPY